MTPYGYEVLIRGRVGEALLGAFEDLTVTVRESRTVVSGDLDQAALIGLLMRIQNLGLEVLEVHRAEGASRPAGRP